MRCRLWHCPVFRRLSFRWLANRACFRVFLKRPPEGMRGGASICSFPAALRGTAIPCGGSCLGTREVIMRLFRENVKKKENGFHFYIILRLGRTNACLFSCKAHLKYFLSFWLSCPTLLCVGRAFPPAVRKLLQTRNQRLSCRRCAGSA